MNARDLIIIAITIILLLSIGIFMLFNSSSSETTILTMTSSSNLNEGDSLILKLNDENGSAISNQKIEINLTDDKGIRENFTLKTNSSGECSLKDLIAGNFSLKAKYYGNKHYKPSTLSGEIHVNKKVVANTNDTAKKDYKSNYKVDDVINGWNPSEHEVSREDLGDGNQRIIYDDGYFRIVDSDGNILTYGY
ncbi:carboxypeptidase-like regulatory domain-containing protein [Methanobrevibacter olleyae]|uniref:Adhesin-like protein n=1 Tax=Methanobrevibacter olleyae TaxID=294671 RepID=A0A126R282_METOL|nr:carboxypeptidase-like regulatory domain-containing protein [Methanobrevibacter olleyae]AMK16146.1 hypothetical protein YLM1_1591 [Methanobrevibacter olleyae]SFL32017.1 hypothetical protein SAMN02910297_00561 [Methanobrevibacter olleyae]